MIALRCAAAFGGVTGKYAPDAARAAASLQVGGCRRKNLRRALSAAGSAFPRLTSRVRAAPHPAFGHLLPMKNGAKGTNARD